MLQQISQHKDPRTLHRRYTKPSSSAVARHMALMDKKDADRRRDARRRPPRGSVTARTARLARPGKGDTTERRRR